MKKIIENRLNWIIEQHNIINIKLVKVSQEEFNMIGKYHVVEIENIDTNANYSYSIYEKEVLKRGLDSIIFEILSYCK